MTKTSVAVLMGGKSPEHDVSLLTGKGVVDNLNKDKYEIIPVIISPSGLNWQVKTLKQFTKLDFEIKRKSADWRKKSKALSQFSIPIQPDIFFIAMHGPFGEDGTLQGMLDYIGAKYTGSGVLSSALAMNKIAFKKTIAYDQLPQPQWLIYKPNQQLPNPNLVTFGPPWVVKPSNQGSSVGISIVKNEMDYHKSIAIAGEYSEEIIIEEYLQGVEVSCGVLGNKNPQPLPVIEICPKNEFFDYESKYTPGMCKEIVPARISPEETKKVQKLAIKVYQSVNCQDFGRVDMIIKNGQPYVLEINTIPGLTPNSLLPQEAAASGITYPKLLDKIITSALKNRSI